MSDDTTRLEELLLEWHEGRISAEQAAELKSLLRDEENRRSLVEHFETTVAILEGLREEKAQAQEKSPARVASPGESSGRTVPETSKPSAHRLQRPASTRMRDSARRLSTPKTTAIPWFAIAATGLIVAGAALLNHRQAAQTPALIIAVVAESRGPVAVIRGGSEQAAPPGFEIREDDRIRSGKDADVTVRYKGDETTSLRLLGDSQARLWSKQGGKRIGLDRGTIVGRVAKQAAGREMLLATPQAEAKVVGTEFTLTAGAETTRLEVKEGRIAFSRLSDRISVDVCGGEYAVVAAGVEFVARPIENVPAAAADDWPARDPKRGKLVYRTDFRADELAKMPRGWAVVEREGASGNWTVAEKDGHRVAQGSGADASVRFGTTDWTDFEMGFRFCVPKPVPEAFSLEFRAVSDNDSASQFVRLNFHKGPDFAPEWMPEGWHKGQFLCRDGRAQFWIDGKSVFQVENSVVQSGNLGFRITQGTVWISEVSVWALEK